MGGFGLDPEQLKAASDGIETVLVELNSGGFAGSGEMGRGMGSLALSGLEAGHAGLQSAVEGFCNRWEWGVRTLVQDGQQYATRLGLATGMYVHLDQYVSDGFKEAGASFFADPHLSGDQLAETPWSDLTQQAITPDYSGQSFVDAGTSAGDAWKSELRDEASGSWAQEQLEESLGIRDDMEQQRDDLLGPLPEDGE